MEMTQTSSVDLRFSNLEAIWTNGISLKLFEDSNRAVAFEEVHSLLRIANDKNLEELISSLTFLHWDLRGHIETEGQAGYFWETKRKSLAEILGLSRAQLTEEELSKGKSLLSSLNLLAVDDSPYPEAILAEIDQEGTTALVVEKSRQREELAGLIDGKGLESSVSVFRLEGFLKLPATKFDRVVILAAPQRLSDNYMRGLLLGGVSSSLSFLAPNWLAAKGSKFLPQNITEGLGISHLPQLSVVGPKYEQVINEVEITEVVSGSVNHAEFEKFTSVGDIGCRLIHISGDLVIPVELDAERISVLTQSEIGGLSVEFREPFNTLREGEVIFNLRDGAEDSFLMDLASEQLGHVFVEFRQGRRAWKKAAQEKIQESGIVATINYLKSNGVTTATHLQSWLDNDDFVSPRALSDWANLLNALGFEKSTVTEYVKLTSKVRSTLISIGQRARSAMADSISSEEWDKITSGQLITKKLPEYGDAEFLIGLVKKIGAETVMCSAMNVRKVLGY
jgi:hypothetical protein